MSITYRNLTDEYLEVVKQRWVDRKEKLAKKLRECDCWAMVCNQRKVK